MRSHKNKLWVQLLCLYKQLI